jgi:hypothetical protein
MSENKTSERAWWWIEEVLLPVLIVAAGTVISVLVGYVAWKNQVDQDAERKALRDVVENRYLVDEDYHCIPKEPLIQAMNKALVDFAEHEEVISAAREILDAPDREGALQRLNEFIAAMSRALNVSLPPDMGFTWASPCP